jgi:hypothetical protein
MLTLDGKKLVRFHEEKDAANEGIRRPKAPQLSHGEYIPEIEDKLQI